MLIAAIYVSVLQNKVTANIKSILAPALLKAGLPATSLMPFIGYLAEGDKAYLVKVPGVTPEILEVALVNFREVYAKAFQTVFLATIAFGALSFIVAFFVPNIDDKLSRDVIRRLGSQSDSNQNLEKTMEDGHSDVTQHHSNGH